VTSAVRSHLGPNRDVRNTIEARRWAESVDNHRDNRSRHHDDRGRGRRHDSDDDCDRNWLPNQRGSRAIGPSIRKAKFSSRFCAPTNVPRYDGDINPSVWLEDYHLARHTGGVTDDLFISVTLRGHGSRTCRGTRSMTGPMLAVNFCQLRTLVMLRFELHFGTNPPPGMLMI
jgi:hypothetical protein